MTSRKMFVGHSYLVSDTFCNANIGNKRPSVSKEDVSTIKGKV